MRLRGTARGRRRRTARLSMRQLAWRLGSAGLEQAQCRGSVVSNKIKHMYANRHAHSKIVVDVVIEYAGGRA